MVSVDSTPCRTHQHAGERAGDLLGCREGSTPRHHRPDEGLGRSRGGLTCKIHLAGEDGRRPLAPLITPGRGSTPRSSARPRNTSVSTARVAGIRAPGPTTWAATRRIPPGATAATCDVARSSTPFPSLEVSEPTTKDEAAGRTARRLRHDDRRTQERSGADVRRVEELPGRGHKLRPTRLRLPRDRHPRLDPAPAPPVISRAGPGTVSLTGYGRHSRW